MRWIPQMLGRWEGDDEYEVSWVDPSLEKCVHILRASQVCTKDKKILIVRRVDAFSWTAVMNSATTGQPGEGMSLSFPWPRAELSQMVTLNQSERGPCRAQRLGIDLRDDTILPSAWAQWTAPSSSGYVCCIQANGLTGRRTERWNPSGYVTFSFKKVLTHTSYKS